MIIDKDNIDVDFLVKVDFIIGCLFDNNRYFTVQEKDEILDYVNKLYYLLSNGTDNGK